MKDLKTTRRKFVLAGAAMGAAIVSPVAFVGQSSVDAGATEKHSLPNGQLGSDCVEPSVPVTVTVAAAKPIRIMRGGIGASFHAISATLPGRNPAGGGSWSGSAWGGNPDAGDDRHWEELFQHADWLGMDWCRVELEQRIYEPHRRVFTWDNSEMQVLYRILDWAERRGTEVFLQQMWGDVDWNAYPGNADDPIKRLRSAPHSIAEWAYGLGELLDHLVKVKKYTCIRWVSVANEPGHDDFSWWQDSDMKSVPFTPGLRAVREEFDRRGLTVPLSGPDWTDLPELKSSDVDFDSYVGAYDLHSYTCVFDSMSDGYTLTEAERRMAAWAQWAHARNKPFFLSEFGTMGYGWGHVDAGPACYQSGLKNASLVVRGINAGVDGFNRWSFTNRGDLDGQWQLLRTWNLERDKLLDAFTPQPNAYYQFAILSRFLSKHSGVFATVVKAPFLPEDRKVVATAVRDSKGNLSVLIVNESYRSAQVSIVLEGLPAATTLHRYAVTKAAEDKCWIKFEPERDMETAGQLSDLIPPMSIVVYSTRMLKNPIPGAPAS